MFQNVTVLSCFMQQVTMQIDCAKILQFFFYFPQGFLRSLLNVKLLEEVTQSQSVLSGC